MEDQNGRSEFEAYCPSKVINLVLHVVIRDSMLSYSYREKMRCTYLLLVVVFLLSYHIGNIVEGSSKFSRDDFPKGFVFGAGSSAYQVEGAAFEDGRSPSIWDTFAHQGYAPATGDIASDQYHKYKDDVRLMVETGLEAYRLSISWSRLIPDGRGSINNKGLEYYNNLIDELISNGIEPHVTLFHYDHPQVLEDEYGGWLSPRIVDDFTAYADVCFKEFGDRVTHWTTLNEANVYALGCYDTARTPPRRCSYPFGNCSAGDSTKEAYLAGHYCLLAHSSAALLYKTKYQTMQQGLIGLNIFAFYFRPLTNKTEDILAARRAQDFFVGWIAEPLVRGGYPKAMKKAAGTKMLQFTKNQSQQLMQSFDFIGLNYYATDFVKDDPNNNPATQRDFIGDSSTKIVFGTVDGLFGPEYPYGLQGVLEFFKHDYGNPLIYIHENGLALPRKGSLNDTSRVQYIGDHCSSLLNAIRNGSNTAGYFIWSFIDVFELFGGYDITYGLYYVDFQDNDKKRYPRLSAHWYSDFLKGKRSIDAVNISTRELSYLKAVT